MYRHLDKDTKRKLKETKKPEEFYCTVLRNGLEMPGFLDRICNAKKSLKGDVYFKDIIKDEWQHLFSIVERKNFLRLEMRPSTSTIDAHNRSCNVKIHVSYDENRNLVLEAGEKNDFRKHFI